ncbi:MAG: hypothetical protein RLZZ116_2383 [Planctomycetota bacterium]|jgi:methionine sulfoxide reductase heme-binding subunit
MSVQYQAVQWNRAKRAYDLWAVGSALGWLVGFVVIGAATTGISPIILALRAFATGAFALLVLILSIGPLARFTPRMAPLLYNRRHLGVLMFLMALAHAALSTVWYHGFGVLDPLASILRSGVPFEGIASLPFQPLGLAALLILLAMAATSHDFWLRNLSARTWKALHQLVYVAFALLVAHIAFGALQASVWPGYAWIVIASAAWIAGIHLAAGVRARRADQRRRALAADGWVEVGDVEEIHEGRAKAVLVGDARTVAVFRHAGGFSAISGVCAHQGGPLAEGRIVDGCVTCPWHGYQYLVDCGQSPPPFFERIPTYELRIEGRTIFVSPQPMAPGTPIPPCRAKGGER